jgi:hypothetical protein
VKNCLRGGSDGGLDHVVLFCFVSLYFALFCFVLFCFVMFCFVLLYFALLYFLCSLLFCFVLLCSVFCRTVRSALIGSLVLLDQEGVILEACFIGSAAAAMSVVCRNITSNYCSDDS